VAVGTALKRVKSNGLNLSYGERRATETVRKRRAARERWGKRAMGKGVSALELTAISIPNWYECKWRGGREEVQRPSRGGGKRKGEHFEEGATFREDRA